MIDEFVARSRLRSGCDEIRLFVYTELNWPEAP